MIGKLITKTKIFKIYERKIKFPNGQKATLEYTSLYNDTLDSVLIAPITKQGKLIFIKEFCQAMGRSEFFFPGGVVDRGESIKQAGIRELAEETGLLARKVKKVGTITILPKYIYAQTHLLAATDLQKTDKFNQGDEVEDIKTQKISLPQATEMIKKGQITDSRTINLILMLIKFSGHRLDNSVK